MKKTCKGTISNNSGEHKRGVYVITLIAVTYEPSNISVTYCFVNTNTIETNA